MEDDLLNADVPTLVVDRWLRIEKDRPPEVGNGDAGGVATMKGGGVSLVGEHIAVPTLLVELFLRK